MFVHSKSFKKFDLTRGKNNFCVLEVEMKVLVYTVGDDVMR
jgi:hypothetical protein